MRFIVPIFESFEEVAELCPPVRDHMVCVEPAVKLLVCFNQAILLSLGISVELFTFVEVDTLQVVSIFASDAPSADQL